MTDRPARCPFCSNTDLVRADDVRWSCVGSLGCGGVWDPTVIVAAPPRLERPEEEEVERSKPALPLRRAGKLLRRRAFRLTDAA